MHTRVLVAETDPQVAALLDEGLRRHSLTPTPDTNAAATLAAVMSGDYPIVIVDLDDDQGGTIAVLRELRAAGTSASVIVMADRYGARSWRRPGGLAPMSRWAHRCASRPLFR